jgi:hypothetical protein
MESPCFSKVTWGGPCCTCAAGEGAGADDSDFNVAGVTGSNITGTAGIGLSRVGMVGAELAAAPGTKGTNAAVIIRVSER